MTDELKICSLSDIKREFLNTNVVRDTESQTAHDRIYAEGWNDCNSRYIEAFALLPSVEISDLIRCKDCIHYPNPYADCPLIGWARNENDFCSYAERRENDDK